MPSAMTGRMMGTMTEFLTWNAAPLGMSDGWFKIGIVVLYMIFVFVGSVYALALAVGLIVDEFFDKKEIRYDARLIDYIEYRSDHLPDGMQCMYMALVGHPADIQECAGKECAGCIYCAPELIEPDDMAEVFMKNILRHSKEDNLAFENV